MMRIVQFTYSLSSGGAERFVVDLSNELIKQGHEIYLIVFYNKLKNKQDPLFFKSLLDTRINYINLDAKEGFRLSLVAKISNTIAHIKPDIVHAHLNVIPYIFPLVFFKRKIKFIHTLHSSAQRTSGPHIQKIINRYFYKSKLIQPVVLSELSKESYRRFYKLDNAIIIENGRSPVQASSAFEFVRNEISSLQNNNSTLVLTHVSRYHEVKNQELLIRSFNKIANEGKDFILLIIGSGFDTELGKKLKKIACEKIIFTGEKMNVGDYLLCSNAFCLSSNDEGLPISLLEALSAGCVPICTAVGGIPDVITDGVTGYLSDSVTLDSYYDAIIKYFQNPQKITRQVLKKHFEANFSIKICAEKYNAYFVKTLSEPIM